MYRMAATKALALSSPAVGAKESITCSTHSFVHLRP